MKAKKIEQLNGKDWQIIFDDGGGATLAVADIYQHTYSDMAHLADDMTALAEHGTDSVSAWEGNELCTCDDPKIDDANICANCDGYPALDPLQEDIASGGYRIINVIDTSFSADDCSWHNVVDFYRAFFKK